MSNTHCIISSSYDKYFLNRADYLDNFLYIYNYLINQGFYLNEVDIKGGRDDRSSVVDMLAVLDSISALNPGFIQSGFSQPDDIHFKGRLGIFGWCDNRDNPDDIINPLMWYANKNNKPWWDIDLQLDLLMHCDDDEIKKCGTQEFVWGWKNINQYNISTDPTDIHTLPKPITFDVFKSELHLDGMLSPYRYNALVALICGLFHVSAYNTDVAGANLLLDDITKNYYSNFTNVYSLKSLLNITTDIGLVGLIIEHILNGDPYDDILGFCRHMYYFECSGPVCVWQKNTFGSKLVTFDNNKYYVDTVNVSMPYYSTSHTGDATDFINQNAEIEYKEYTGGIYRSVFIKGYPVGGIIVASMPGATPPAVFPFKKKKTYQPWMPKRKNLEKVKRYV